VCEFSRSWFLFTDAGWLSAIIATGAKSPNHSSILMGNEGVGWREAILQFCITSNSELRWRAMQYHSFTGQSPEPEAVRRNGDSTTTERQRWWTGSLAFRQTRLTDRRARRRWLFCREEYKQRNSNYGKDHNVLGAIFPVHPVRRGLRRHNCHREPMGKA
jgi:hypothetical protein